MQRTKTLFPTCLMVIALLATTTPIETQASSVEDMHVNTQVRQAIKDLAQLESMSLADIEVISAEDVVWPDTSMGCPQPGMRYQQVPQDGMRIILRAKGRQLIYHSGGNRTPFLCNLKTGKQGLSQTERSLTTGNVEN